jgi:hypothetical protein
MAKKKRSASEAPAARTLVTVPSNGIPTYYVNNASMEISNWDVRFKLGQIQKATESTIEITDVAYLFMSHAHARAFAIALKTTLDKLDSVLEQAKNSGENPQ